MDKQRRRDEVRHRIGGLLDGLPVVYQVRGHGADPQTATVEFIDGTVLELTDRTHDGMGRMVALARASGVWLERARCTPGQRSWLLRFWSLGGKRVTVIAGVKLPADSARADRPTTQPGPAASSLPDDDRDRRQPQ